jgi:hypothetical protein
MLDYTVCKRQIIHTFFLGLECVTLQDKKEGVFYAKVQNRPTVE